MTMLFKIFHIKQVRFFNENLNTPKPKLLPYIGYWQLIYAVDTFVIYDDVNFVKRSFINYNSILIKQTAKKIYLGTNWGKSK